jgi:hypothetical protein
MKITLIILLLLAQPLFSQAKYELSCNSKLLIKSEEIAFRQVGVIELKNKNDGKDIKNYLLSVGIKQPAPYCAAGVYFCFLEACIVLDLPQRSIPIIETGVASRIYSNARNKGRQISYSARRHDLIIWKKAKSWQGHIERIIEVLPKGWVRTIAFNTKHGKQEGVFIKKRNIYHPLGRLRILGLVGFRGKEK